VIDLSILAKLLGYHPHKVRKFAFKFLQNTQDGLTQMEAALGAAMWDAARAGPPPQVAGPHRRCAGHGRTAAGTGTAAGRRQRCRQCRARQALLQKLWPLLEQITEQIMTNTTFADDN
jgi:hypothetical protein